jgi:hypothetical protein
MVADQYKEAGLNALVFSHKFLAENRIVQRSRIPFGGEGPWIAKDNHQSCKIIMSGGTDSKTCAKETMITSSSRKRLLVPKRYAGIVILPPGSIGSLNKRFIIDWI